MNTNVHKLISINAVIPSIFQMIPPDSGITLDFIQERVSNAWAAIWTKKVKQNRIILRAINNHIVELPKSFYAINTVMYKPDLDDEDLEELVKTLQIDLVNEVVTEKNLFEFKKSRLYSGFAPMRVGHDAMTLYYMATGAFVNNACMDCEHTFSIENEYCMKVSPRKGFVLIEYECPPVGSDGFYLIPDIQSIRDALYLAGMYAVWEYLYNYAHEGADGRMQKYRREYTVQATAAQNDLLLLNLFEHYNALSTNKIVKNAPYSRIFFSESFEHVNLQ